MHRVAHNRSAGSCTRIWYIHARSEFSDSHQPAIYGRARKRTRAVIRKASYRPGTVEESNLDIIIIATTEPRTKLSIFRLLRNRAKEIRKRFSSRRCSIIQTKKNKETIERIGSNQGLNASLPIVYRRRVTPRSSLLHIYIYIYTRLYESGARTNWQSADSERKSIFSERLVTIGQRWPGARTTGCDPNRIRTRLCAGVRGH